MDKKDKKKRAFTIRVTSEQYEEIAYLATENGRSVSGEILELIKDARAYRELPAPLLPQELQKKIVECALGFVLNEGGVPPEKVNALSLRLIAKRLLSGSIALDVLIPISLAAVIVSLLAVLVLWLM